MIDVKAPVLLDANLQPVRTLNVENVDLTLNSPGVSQATITPPPNETEPPIHAFLDLYNQHGFVGVFRVSVPTTDYAQQHSIVARHGIDTLADSVFAAQTEFSGTVTQFLTQLLSYQTTKVGGVSCWQLGTCQDANTIKKSLNYDRLNDLLSALEEEEDGYYFTYDQTSFPWTLNFLSKPQGIGTEFRRGRNIRSLSRTLNDNDLCTQLILSVNVETTTTDTTTGNDSTTTETAIRTYDNAAAQAVYGIIQRTADIDTHDDIAGQSFPEADAWAQRFLADHASPTVQMQIDGDEYSAQTGDSLDETKLGHLCAVPLPEYGQDFTLRIVSVRYPNALSDPRHVTASLATQLPRFSGSIASLKKAEAATAKAARSAARSAAKATELKQWSMVVTDQQLALDGTGIMELYETGISMDAQGGAKIYSLQQGFQSNYAAIQVNTQAISAEITRATQAEGTLSANLSLEAGKISQIVQAIGSNGQVTAASVVLAVNNAGSSVVIDADHIDINGLVTKLETMAIGVGSLHVEGRSDFLRDIYAEDYIHTDEYVSAANGFYGSGFYIGTYGGTTVDVADAVDSIGPATASGGQITIPWTRLDGTAGTPINFNIAATQFYIDGVAAAEAAGIASVTLSQAAPSNGVVRVSASNGEYEDVDWRTADLISKITLGSSDTGTDVQKTANVRYNNGDSTTSVPVTIDASAVYAAGQAQSTFDISKLTINLGNDYDATAQVPSKTTERQNNRVLVSGKIGVWYDGAYIGELRTFSISVGYGTPYINNPAAGYVRGAATINGDTITGNSIELTASQISSWGGPTT